MLCHVCHAKVFDNLDRYSVNKTLLLKMYLSLEHCTYNLVNFVTVFMSFWDVHLISKKYVTRDLGQKKFMCVLKLNNIYIFMI